MFPVPVLESAISPWSPSSFHWKMIYETKIWVLGMLVATGVSFLAGLFSWQRNQFYLKYCVGLNNVSLKFTSVHGRENAT